MEFVEGGNLRDFIKIRKQLEPVEAMKYGLDIARGLEYALTQGITHRDMKTTNVLMSSQGVAKLIDFGLAADDSFFNRPGSPDLAQALEYSTLERNTNAPSNDPRSDLFFVGTILYELISGQPPYPRTRDREERKQFSRYRDIRPLAGVMPTLDWHVASLVDRLVQINPGQRFQSPTELASDLETVLKHLGHKPAETGRQPSKESETPTILCVESRPKRQDVLREYFSKHGYRLLLMGDIDRALNRLKNNPPDGLILFGDIIGDPSGRRLSTITPNHTGAESCLGSCSFGKPIRNRRRPQWHRLTRSSVNSTDSNCVIYEKRFSTRPVRRSESSQKRFRSSDIDDDRKTPPASDSSSARQKFL